MEKEEIKNFWKFIRAVDVSESRNIDYSDITTYLKTSEKHKMITEMEAYADYIISKDQYQAAKLSYLESQRVIWYDNKIIYERQIKALTDEVNRLKQLNKQI